MFFKFQVISITYGNFPYFLVRLCVCLVLLISEAGTNGDMFTPSSLLQLCSWESMMAVVMNAQVILNT